MTDYNDETDSSECYSSIIPYWTDGTTTVVGDKQTSSYLPPSGRDACVPMDVSQKFESQPTKAQVNSMGASILNSGQSWLPSQNITVSFVRLQDTAEYSQFSSLLRCGLCDTIKVIFPDYNSSGVFKIVRTVWDVLSERYEEMELGDLSISLSEALGISDIQKDSKSTIEQILTKLDAIDDYVVDQGTDNSWTYRKWNSGRYEAWRYYQATGLVLTSASAGTYYGNPKTVSLPSFATTLDCCTYGNTTSQGSGIYIYNVQKVNANLSIAYRAHASQSNGSCGGYFHIIGTWQ